MLRIPTEAAKKEHCWRFQLTKKLVSVCEKMNDLETNLDALSLEDWHVELEWDVRRENNVVRAFGIGYFFRQCATQGKQFVDTPR